MIPFQISFHRSMRFVLLSGAISLVMCSHSMMGAQKQTSDTDAYNRARARALKDPKVRSAFDKANQELDRKIVEIDPSLQSKPRRQASRADSSHHLASSTASTERGLFGSSSTHVVGPGETLTSVAIHHKISVVRLARANHLSNNSKLRVGQKLIIPKANTTAASHARENMSLWDKVKSKL